MTDQTRDRIWWFAVGVALTTFAYAALLSWLDGLTR